MKLLWLPLLTGCVFTRAAEVPMPAVQHAAAQSSRGLIVLLPGFGDGPEDYLSNGFVEMIQRANPGFEVIAADAHFGYYRDFSVVDRLHRDVIAPALEREKRSVWLVGISMGGLGAASYAMEHEDLVEGVILLAPYMGDSDVIEEVKAAGGLSEWSPPEKWQEIEDAETRKYYQLWSWYKEFATTPETQPKLFIGHGLDDSLGGPNDLVAGVLPDDRSETLPGGHKWKVWKPLFATLVQRALTE